MMKRHKIILLLIFLGVLLLRLQFAYYHENFSYEAYSNIRHIENIRETGNYITEDSLSYGGRNILILPFFHYLLGFISVIFPLDFVLKFFPNLFASTVVFIAYMIIFNWTENRNAALFSSFIAGFTPIFFSDTISSVSPMSLFIPLLFLFLYSFTRLNKNFYVILFVILAFILPLIDISSLLLVATFLLYLLFAHIENFEFKGKSIELTLFFSFFSIWFTLIIFKKAFLLYGYNIIANAVPEIVRENYFQNLNFLQLFGGLGLLSIVAGSYVIYFSLFQNKDRRVYLFFSLICTSLLFMWFNILKTSVGLIIIALCLSILTGLYYPRFFNYLKHTNFAHLEKFFIAGFIFFFSLSSVLFSIVLAFDVSVAQDSEIRVMEWAKLNTPKDSTMVAPVQIGNIITSIAERKNIADEQYLLAPFAEDRLRKINNLYLLLPRFTSTSSIIQDMDFYNSDYIYLPTGYDNRVLENDKSCFRLEYNKELKVYKKLCRSLRQ